MPPSSSRTPPRFWPLAALILLPVLVLAGVAGYGLNSLAETQRKDAASRLEPVLSAAVEALEGSLREALAESPPVFLPPGNPVPGESSPAAGQLESCIADGDVEGLRALRDDRDAAWMSESGLPVRTLAAWHVWQLTGDPEDAAALAEVAMEVPCLLSGDFIERMLSRAAETHPGAAWITALREEWRISQDRRWVVEQASARNGDEVGLIELEPSMNNGQYELYLDGGAGVLTSPSGEPGLWLVDRDRDGDGLAIRTLSPDEITGVVQPGLANFQSLLPAWAAFRLPALEQPDFEKRAVFGNPLLSAKTRSGIDVGIIIRDHDAYHAAWRSLRNWSVAIIGTALLAACIGLWLVRRTLTKERRLGEMKSQFVSSVSHELRAPVGSLRLMAEGLASGKITGPAADEFHRLMAGEGARLSSLIENVLDFARIEQGRKEYHCAETDVAALVYDAVKLMTPQAEARGLKLMLNAPPLPFAPCVDAGALQQALINLIDNAIKFTPPNDVPNDIRVNLSCDPSRNLWSLSVTDPGIGIPRGEHERIFDRFYRLGNELRRETTGTGIGLAIVKHIVEGHGGIVRVFSAPGRGSEFRVEFSVSSVQFSGLCNEPKPQALNTEN